MCETLGSAASRRCDRWRGTHSRWPRTFLSWLYRPHMSPLAVLPAHTCTRAVSRCALSTSVAQASVQASGSRRSLSWLPHVRRLPSPRSPLHPFAVRRQPPLLPAVSRRCCPPSAAAAARRQSCCLSRLPPAPRPSLLSLLRPLPAAPAAAGRHPPLPPLLLSSRLETPRWRPRPPLHECPPTRAMLTRAPPREAAAALARALPEQL